MNVLRALFGVLLAALAGPALAAQIFLTGSGNWTVPRDYSDAGSTIEVIAGGGGGYTVGGGGGAYSKLVSHSLTPGASIAYVAGAAGAGGGAGSSGGDSWFQTTGTLLAKGGHGGNVTSPGVGGSAAAGVGDIKYSGGSSGGPRGGGGAAGPHGNGGDGSGTCAGGTGTGGAGDAGFGGAGGFPPGSLPGSDGTEFDGSHGTGGGGGCSIGGGSGHGGAYGGGGSGVDTGTSGADARPGLIVINYTPRRSVGSGAF